MNEPSIKDMVQKRLTDAWGWLPDEPEAEILAGNVEFLANLLVIGTRTRPETLISALCNGPNWGQGRLLEEWEEAARPDYEGFHNSAGFAMDNAGRILDILRKIV